MAWVRVDDRMARGPKVKRAAAALGGKFPRRRVLAVWLEAMSYCNLNTTDGFVPDFEVADIEDERPNDVFLAMAKGDDTLGAIVERDDVRGGWVFRNYFEYQPSRASIEEKTEHERVRKANARAKKARPVVVQKCPTGTAPDGADVSAPPVPTRPDPDRSDPNTHGHRDRDETETGPPPAWRASEPRPGTLVEPMARLLFRALQVQALGAIDDWTFEQLPVRAKNELVNEARIALHRQSPLYRDEGKRQSKVTLHSALEDAARHYPYMNPVADDCEIASRRKAVTHVVGVLALLDPSKLMLDAHDKALVTPIRMGATAQITLTALRGARV